MCRFELVFDGISGRARVEPDDDQMLVRPDYDRRKAENGETTPARDRRRAERRRRVTVH
jgi:hypothetical protein